MIHIIKRKRKITSKVLIALFTLTFFQINNASAVNQNNNTQMTETKIVKKGEAGIVYTDIRLFAGKMEINGGCNDLIKARFTFKDADFKPLVEYTESPEIGNLMVHLKLTDLEFDIYNNNTDQDIDWIMELNNHIPQDLELKMGAGKGIFNLGDLNLENLDITVGAGEFDINLKNSSVPNFTFIAGAGEVEIDLSGERNKNLNSEMTCGFGELTVFLPKNISTKVIITGLAGSISYKGFEKNGNEYTNENYQKTKNYINLKITGAMGEINLELVD